MSRRKNNAPKKSQAAATCIFCGDRDLSKQHIFGDRINALFRQPVNVFRQPIRLYRQHDTYEGSDLNAPGATVQRVRPGTAYSAKLRVACRSCNHGWMREIEERAYPKLVRLFRSESFVLSADDQRDVAAWITLVSMVAEYLKPDAIVTPQASRTEFMKSQITPAGWQVWIAPYNGFAFNTCSTHYVSWTRAPVLKGGSVPLFMDVQHHTTVFWIGRLFCHVFFSTNPILISLPEPKHRFQQITPGTESSLTWPTAAFIDLLVLKLMEELRRFYQSPVRPLVGSGFIPPGTPQPMRQPGMLAKR